MEFLEKSKLKGRAVGDAETILEVPKTILFSEETRTAFVVRGIKGIVGVEILYCWIKLGLGKSRFQVKH